MKLLRLAALALAASVMFLSSGAQAPVYAQLQRAAPIGPSRPPNAAPTNAVGGGAPIAAPSGTVDAELVGPQGNENEVRTFTPLGLFERADVVVKAVLLLLVLASFWVWVRIIDKWLGFATLRRKANKFEAAFWSGRSLDELYQHYSQRADHPIAAVFVAGLREWKRSFENGPPRDTAIPGVKDRVEKAMTVAIQRESEKLERGMGYLATDRKSVV